MSKSYKMLNIVDRTRMGASGDVERYYRVGFETAGGTSSHVDIDEADFNKEKVNEVLEARAKELDEILNL